MKLIFFFLAISALFTAAAIPMRPPGSSSTSAPPPSSSAPDPNTSAPEPNTNAPNPNYVPKVEFGAWRMLKHDKTAAENIISDHYKGLEPSDERKGARLALVRGDWHDGRELDDQHMQYIDLDYYRDTSKSDKIGQTATLSRVRPPPVTHFGNSVPREHKSEMAKLADKEYKALPPSRAKLVRSMKVDSDWGEGSGLREETQFTYHHAPMPRSHNIIGNPVTIYRPMSFHIGDKVSERQAPVITKRIRQEHENLDENHPLKQANYGVVSGGWHSYVGSKGLVAGATLYKVMGKPSEGVREDFEKVGNFQVGLGTGRKSEVSGPLASSSTQRVPSL